MKTLNVSILIISIGLLLAALALVVVAQTGRAPDTPVSVGTAFTYQGILTDNDEPANGTYDLQFKLYDAATGGQQIGSTVTLNNTAVTDGLFLAELDFGAVFTGTARYLEMAARPASGGNFETLLPRQPLQPAPYALYALSPTTIERGFTPAVYSDRAGTEVSEGLHRWPSSGYSKVIISFKVPEDYVSGDLTIRTTFYEHDTGAGATAVMYRHIWKYRKIDGAVTPLPSGPANFIFGSSFRTFAIAEGLFEAGDLIWIREERDGDNGADDAGRLDLMAIGVEYMSTGR